MKVALDQGQAPPKIQAGKVAVYRGGGSMQKVGGLKYLAPNINVYVLMIFTAFSLKSGGGACPPCPPYSTSYGITQSTELQDKMKRLEQYYLVTGRSTVDRRE